MMYNNAMHKHPEKSLQYIHSEVIMRHSNLHTHTIFSDGAHTPEENILSAIEKNMVSLGFSDHSFTAFDRRYCMRRVNIPAYIREIRRLQEKYKGQIEIYLGMELDGFSDIEDRELYDYLIGDCHYVHIGDQYFSVDHARAEQLDAINRYFGGDAIAYSRAYFDTYVACTEKIKPDILGHFDLSAKFGHVDETSPVYQRYAAEALLACLDVTPYIEMNTGAISRKIRTTPYPAVFLLKEILAHHGCIVLNSDSHDAANLDFYFDQSVELLKSVGFKSIAQLRGGRFTEVGIGKTFREDSP